MGSKFSHEVRVGIFTVVGAILFCLSVILLGGDRFFLTKQYTLRVRVPQAVGLNKGSVVSLTGVPVGNVTKVSFIEGSHEVELTVSIEQGVQKRITQGSLATVKTQGALGDKYVYVAPGPMDAAPLQDGDILETDKTPDFLDIIAAKGAELGQVTDVVKEVHILLKNINNENKSARLMTNLVATTENLNKTIQQAQDTFAPMSRIMTKIDKGQGTLGALINDPSLYNRLMSIVGQPARNKFLKPLIRDSIETNEK
jgi:phospholipid/cholesterol/gamma-HCH transport system substrate-binding protein